VIVIVPHSTYHNIRGPAIRALGRVDDIVVVLEKDVLEEGDFHALYQRSREIAEDLRSKGVREVALVLTGSYLACALVYRALLEEGLRVTLLQWDPRRKSYIVFRTPETPRQGGGKVSPYVQIL
jgi:hypothetical protein